ncbi:hypothetical protein GCM10009740_16890 [Terrabacter terrae]|uniref:HTH iclR-type domain-containing protein n=1 Tax=Terrabacter terrae TaxID=318434 RepID=A0ABP5FMG3_9MICO
MLDDTWFSRDMPVLEAAVALLEESRPPVSDSGIAARTGIDRQHVMKALEALEEDFLDVGWDDRADLRVSGAVAACTSAARRATGQWPSAESLAERAIAVVDERIENATDDAERSRWVKLRDGLAGAGRDLVVDVMGAVVSRQITGA